MLHALGTSWTHVGTVLAGGVAGYAAVIALTRLAGVRSLAKMSTFDFAATVAMGSTLASVLLASTPLLAGLLALALLFGLQYAVALLRRLELLHGVVDNRPLLLVARGEVLAGNLRHARVSRAEVLAQLRLHGLTSLQDAYAVVMETTGDVSVLAAPVDAVLLEGVRGAEALR